MRIAIVSDIHGNGTAFRAVLADLKHAAPDVVLHGGDLADAGSSGVEIVGTIRSLGWRGVVGNTDELLAKPEAFEEFAAARPQLDAIWKATREMAAFRRAELGEERLDWLRALPLVETVEGVGLVHASPESAWKSPAAKAADSELDAVYGGLGQAVVVFGHIHTPFVRRTGRITVANSGSAGLPYDGDRRACYLLVEDGKPEVRRVEYDVDGEIASLRASGMPHADWVGRMLESAGPQMP